MYQHRSRYENLAVSNKRDIRENCKIQKIPLNFNSFIVVSESKAFKDKMLLKCSVF